MKFKELLFFIFVCTFCTAIFAQALDLGMPVNTQLIDKKTNILHKDGNFEESEFVYDSQLTKNNILSFYQKNLGQQDFKEKAIKISDQRKANGFFFFRKSDYKHVKLIFLGKQNGITRYKINVIGPTVVQKKSGCQGPNCGLKAGSEVEERPFYKKDNKVAASIYLVEPKKVNFMPMLPGIKQGEYIEWRDSQPPMITAGYLSRQDASAVIDFYLQQMPSYGWNLAENKPHQGSYSVKEWIPMIAPYTAFQHNYEHVFTEDVPLLKIRGAALTFTNDSQKCIITVNTFDDVLSLAAQQTTYDLKIMEDFGTTVIGVAYFYEGA